MIMGKNFPKGSYHLIDWTLENQAGMCVGPGHKVQKRSSP